MHIYKYVQSHIIIFIIIIIIIIRQHFSGALVAIMRVSYNRNTINIQIIIKNVS